MILNYLSKLLLTETRLAELGYRKETQEDRDALLPIIEFICEPAHRLVMVEPEPASKNIAKWWKRIKPYPEGEFGGQTPRDHFGGVSMTAKHCLPLFDGMALGYTMVAPVDINVRTRFDGGEIHLTSGPNYNGASTHNPFQFGGPNAPGYPMPAIKFHNPWMIKTRPGYSTLFLPMLNWLDDDEDRFTCFAAAVDTDEYPKQVNFPGLFHKHGYDGIIKAGTPLVTAIPYKRSDVPRDLIIRTITAAEKQIIANMERIQNSRSGMYTRELREDRKNLGGSKIEVLKDHASGCPMMHAGNVEYAPQLVRVESKTPKHQTKEQP